VNIVPATLSDIPFLVNLINESYRGASTKGWTSERHLLDGVRITSEQLADQMHFSGGHFFKYEEEPNNPLANVYLEIEKDSLYLGMLAVSPEIQGKGIGKGILNFAEKYAVDHQLKRIYMTVLAPRTELIEWYIRQGYRDTGKRKPFLGDTLHYIPKVPLELIYMEKFLE
jgi:ribosomal protein S18 acetylase RimI-like enzyme